MQLHLKTRLRLWYLFGFHQVGAVAVWCPERWVILEGREDGAAGVTLLVHEPDAGRHRHDDHHAQHHQHRQHRTGLWEAGHKHTGSRAVSTGSRVGGTGS